MKIKEYILYTIVLYLIYIIISTEYSIIEHIKKDTIINPMSGRSGLNIGDWKLITSKSEKCEMSTLPVCDKLYIQDPYGTKYILKEIEADVLDKKY